MDSVDLFLGNTGIDGTSEQIQAGASHRDVRDTNDDARKASAELLVKLFMHQLAKGCSDPMCETRTCYSHRKRMSDVPIRQLSELSIKATAFYFASLPRPYEELCPRVSLEDLKGQDAFCEANLDTRKSEGQTSNANDFRNDLEGNARLGMPNKDPKSFIQALFDTRAIKDFIQRPATITPQVSKYKSVRRDVEHEAPKYIPSLSELRRKLRGDSHYTQSSLAGAYDLLAQKTLIMQVTGDVTPLVRAMTVSLEVLSAWIDFHHVGESDTRYDQHSQYADDVAQALDEEPAMLLANRLVEILSLSMRLVTGRRARDYEQSSKREERGKGRTTARRADFLHFRSWTPMEAVLMYMSSTLLKSEEKLYKALTKDMQPHPSKTTKSWFGASLLLTFFHVTARILLYNWDGKGHVDFDGMAGKCLLLLAHFKTASRTWDVKSHIQMHGGANDFQLPELEMRLDFYEAASALFNQPDKALSLLKYPWMFSSAAQAKHFRAMCFHRMQHSVEEAKMIHKLIFTGYASEIMPDSQFFGRPKSLSGGVLQSACSRYFTLNTRRKCLLSDAFDQLWRRQERELLRPLRVNIGNVGEEGLDQGGVAQEFLRGAMAEAFHPSYGCFLVDSKTRIAWFDPKSVEPLHKFELLGLLCALAVHNGFNLSINFPLALYKKMLGEKVECIRDIEDGWPELARGLQQLQDWSEGDVADVFSRTYVFSFSGYGETLHVDMTNPASFPRRSTSASETSTLAAHMPSSSAVAEQAPLVTNANRQQYVKDYIRWLVHLSVQPQYDAFVAGFTSLVSINGPSAVLQCVSATTLRTLVEGQHDIDVAELQAGTLYEGYTTSSPTVVAFWAIVHGYSQAQLRQLLEFVTATDRIPVTGARGLEFLIQKNGDDTERLPTATTCFGRLLLPDYADADKLDCKLKIAIENATGFGLC